MLLCLVKGQQVSSYVVSKVQKLDDELLELLKEEAEDKEDEECQSL